MSSSVENNQNANFNPSWMKSPANNGGGGGGGAPVGQGQVWRLLGDPTDGSDYPLATPVFAKHRYGREEMLALVGKDSEPPEGLQQCAELFVPQHQPPITITSLSERETSMVQTNINSSKAMSSLTPAERAQVNGTSGSGFQRGTPAQSSGGGWTPVKSSWGTRGASTVTRGSTTPGRGGFGAGTYGARGGATPSAGAVNDDGSSQYGQRYVPRSARGTPPLGRGGSTAAGSFNTRAQNLYDPRDPKDRPRQRLRSTSDDDVTNLGTPSSNNGWQTVRGPNPIGSNNGWSRRTTREEELPEWFDHKEEEDSDNILDRDSGHERTNSNPERSKELPQREAPPREIEQHERPAWARQVSASGLSAAQQAAAEAAGSSANPAYQDLYKRSQPQQAPSPPKPAVFYYLDPSQVERGPFEKQQMDQWFKVGYFESNLLLRMGTEGEFKTLGELQKINGAETPFDFKEPTPPPPQPAPVPHHPSQYAGMMGWPSSGVDYLYGQGAQQTFNHPAMYRDMHPAQPVYRPDAEEMMARLLKQREEEEQRRLELQNKEEQLRAYQEQIALREAQMKEEAMELAAQLLREREELAEKARRVEEQRLADEQKRQEEHERRRAEEEEARRAVELKREEEERNRKRVEEDDRRRRAELGAEAERKRLEAAAREAAETLKQKESEKRRRDDETARLAELKAAQEEMERFNVTEAWEVAGKPKKEEKKEKAKSAPWTGATAQREKTMAEIMEEEERAAAAERKRVEAIRKEENRQQTILSSATWSGAASRIAATPKPRSPNTPTVWAAVPSEPARVNPLLDGPPLPSAKPAAKKAPAPARAAPAAQAKNTKPAAPTLQQWAITRMKQLNAKVEADVLYSFIADLMDPGEVDDYVTGYLGDTKQVKEFIKDFMKKRSDLRGGKKVETTTSTQQSSSSEWATAAQSGKNKKKGKGRTMVVDGSCLGFTPAGDPNRTNKGEIETVPLVPNARR